VVPLLTVLLIGALVLWVGAPRPVVSARAWGGPTEKLSRWTGWVEVGARNGLGRPLSGATLHITARASRGLQAETIATLDANGQAELALSFGERPPEAFVLTVRHEGRTLAEGDVRVTVAEWRARASQRGGYFPVSSRGSGILRAAPARGAFAVPFEGPLWMRAERAGPHPAPGVRVELSSSGGRIQPNAVVTDEHGLAAATLTPFEHVVTLNARVAFGPGASADLTASVPIVPGASMAERRGDVLVVRSPVERSEVFVTLVSEAGRLAGARVPLRSEGNGMSNGTLALPADLPAETWAVVESARGAPHGERVGWPLFAPRGEPAFTFDARDVLVLDGFPSATKRERDRQLAVRRIALAMGLGGAFFSALSVYLNARRESRRLTTHLDAQLAGEDGKTVLAKPVRGGVLLAMTLIALGFLLVAAVTAWRLG
jgi:hypothetical protein